MNHPAVMQTDAKTAAGAEGHVPGLDRQSFWARDPLLPRLVARLLPAEDGAREEPTLEAIGAAAAGAIEALAVVADREPPRLVTRDPSGARIDRIDYHPAYRGLEELAYGRFRLVGAKYDPALRARGVAHRVGFLRSLLFGMSESGVLCPVCMTDGVARVVERSGDAALAAEVVGRLTWGVGDARATGAMHLTEKAGGSDVGQTETRARPAEGGDGKRWLLSGEKWFCSNVDAELILALARPEGAAAGTRGLGLFLIDRAEQSPESFRIERLKDKLGTRSMPTGEVLLADAPARLVGPLDAGFKQMAGMLNLSRLYNAVISCSLIGRSWLEARSFAERRVTFGKPVAEHPLAREVLADMEAEYAGALAITFEAVAAMDAADGGDAEAEALLRALTPLIKLFTGKVAVATASEAVEFLGGCGYMEDWPTPRILRDAQVLPIWEGTTNILSLDLLRVGRQGHLARLFARGRAALERSRAPVLADVRERAAGLLDRAEEAFTGLIATGEQAGARRAAFVLARGLEAALLLEAAEGEPDGPEGRAARRLAAQDRGPCL